MSGESCVEESTLHLKAVNKGQDTERWVARAAPDWATRKTNDMPFGMPENDFDSITPETSAAAVMLVE
jgi:hypothetical protein